MGFPRVNVTSNCNLKLPTTNFARDLKHGIKLTENTHAHITRPAPKPLTAEERAELEAKWEAEKIKQQQEAEARKIEEAKKAEEARIKALKDGTSINKLGIKKYPAENNALEAPVIENEKSLPKRTRNMINILREKGYVVEYQNGILKGEYLAKDKPWFRHQCPCLEDYYGFVLIDVKSGKKLGCTEKLTKKYYDCWNRPEISIGRKGQIKIIERKSSAFSNPYIETTYYDKDSGEFIQSIKQATYDDNPYRNLFGMEPTPKLNKEAVTYHKIVTTKEPDGTFKSVLHDPHTLSVAEYTGEENNKTLKIAQWEKPTSEECEILTLTADDLKRFDRYRCSEYFHRIWDKGSGYDIPTYPTLDEVVPRIGNIKRAKERIDQLFEAGHLKFRE